MGIVVVGMDHVSAPIAWRERLVCAPGDLPCLLKDALQDVQEYVLLSTCNRVEWYAACADVCRGTIALQRRLSEICQTTPEEFEQWCYVHTDEDAIVHLFEVTCGLHSLVPGEPQIQGQVADALEKALAEGVAGPLTSALFRAALVTGKRARRETDISRHATSVSHVAVLLARHFFADLRQASVLLIGSGRMSELAARNLCDNGAQRLVIINRTRAHAIALAERFHCRHRPFDELLDALCEADVVISSTAALQAVITPALVRPVMELRAGRPLLLIDIALPRDIDPRVATIPGVHLYNLDDLHAWVHESIRLRMQEVDQVQAIIAQEIEAFRRWLRSLAVITTISDLRQQVDVLRQQEINRALRHLAATLSERDLAYVQDAMNRLTNKVLHLPTIRLKEAAADGYGEVYAEAVRYLFDLDQSELA